MTGERAATVVHLGLGAFHRAHQAVYTADATDSAEWSITGVAPRSPVVVDAMRRQDLSYHVLTMGGGHPSARQMRIHGDVLTAAVEPERVRSAIADPRSRIITLTVTERGYTYDVQRRLDTTNPALVGDLRGLGKPGHVPGTVLGHLVDGLWARWHAGGEPLAVVSCDNIISNGHLTKSLVQEMIGNLETTSASIFLDWVQNEVTFPSTMVDRIVPATGPSQRELVRQLTGRDDAIPVSAEAFGMWVMEDAFPAGRPDWAPAGVVFSSQVAAYEGAKLSLLNGTHSLLACLGVLAGLETIDATIRDELLLEAARAFMLGEVLPHLELPDELDGTAYVDSLLERFANPDLGHRCVQVASDGSSKLPQRLGPVVSRAVAAGCAPKLSALVVAAWLSIVVDPEFDEVAEPDRESIRASRVPGDRAPERYLESGPLGLQEHAQFQEDVIELFATIDRSGASAALRSVVTA